MKDEELGRAYRRGLERPDSARTDCPSPEQLAALVEPDGPEGERLAVFDHVMRCTACSRDFELLRAVSRVAVEIPGRRRFVALAASIALLLGVGAFGLKLLLRSDERDVLRGGAPGPAMLAPTAGAPVERPVVLRWRAAPGARSYTAEILADDGRAIGTWDTPDTAFVVPESAAMVSGHSYAWWVRARLSDGTESRSAAVRFQVR